MKSLRLLLVLVPVGILAACGGQSFSDSGDDDDDAGSGGTSAGRGGQGGGGGTGHSGSAGRGGTGQAGTGQAGTGEGGTGQAGTGQAGTGQGGTGQAGTGQAGTVGCCLAFPACPDGEHQVIDTSECTPDGGCHEVTACCSTIICASDIPQCNAFPSCDPGDTTLMGECPPDGPCYSRTLCGSTVWCLDTTCDPATEYNREYLSDSCETIDFECTTPNTKMFSNDCGCGCEQDSTCPEFLYCYYAPLEGEAPADRAPPNTDPAPPATGGTSSGGAALPLCDSAEIARCPYAEHY